MPRCSGQTNKWGSLTIGTTDDPDTLDPLTTQLVSSRSILSGIMEGMLGSNSKGGTIYRLATSYQVSKNGLVYSWHLRHSVKFQDGEPFNARVVLDNWKAIVNPKFGAFSPSGWTDISSINTPDRYTVVMHTRKRYGRLARRLRRPHYSLTTFLTRRAICRRLHRPQTSS